MTRAAIYARYSTDLQSEASIEDQVRICQQRAKADGAQVVETYADHGLSGASMMRPGIQTLMQHATARRFDVLIAESLDRLSRDQEDIAAIYKRLSFSGVRIVTLSEGEITQLHIGLKGTMNALFLKDLADKTRRGLRGRVAAGRSGGGNCYGYDVLPGEERGGRTINEAEAEVVHRIFENYAQGKSPKAIAAALNREGIPGPSGAGWGQSTINGNRQRGTGILNNELYIGRLIWNRLRYVKDPVTGNRVSRQNPESEWVINDVPELRIVEADLWERVKARQRALTRQGDGFWAKQRPRNLFSGLIRCGCCGGGYSMVSKTHLGCSNARNKGDAVCGNRRTIDRQKLEADVLAALRGHLMEPDLCQAFCEEYTRHMNRLRREHDASLGSCRTEHARIARQIGQMVDAIADGMYHPSMKEKMQALETRRIALEDRMQDVEEAPPLLHPGMALRYKERVARMIDTLSAPEHRAEASGIVRSLVAKIVLTPDESEDRLVADLHGDLAGILAMSAGKRPSAMADEAALAQHRAALGLESGFGSGVPVMQDKLVAGARSQLDLRNSTDGKDKLVAGAGFEPAAFRL